MKTGYFADIGLENLNLATHCLEEPDAKLLSDTVESVDLYLLFYTTHLTYSSVSSSLQQCMVLLDKRRYSVEPPAERFN